VSAPVRATARRANLAELRLSAVEFDACWELLGLGSTPPALRLPSPGHTWQERHEILTSVLAGLRRRGLADRSAPGNRVAGPLRLLAGPDYQLDLRLRDGRHGTLIGIGASAAGYGVLLARHRDQLRLRPVRPAQLVDAVVGLAGPIRAGVGRAVNMPAEVFDAAREATTDGKLWTMADQLLARGVPRLDAASWVRMCTGIRTVGQIGTAFWLDGMPRFGPWMIGFQATEAGHFLQLRRPGQGGEAITVCPLDAPGLARLTDELLAEGAAR
jgi:hypothetical protein